METILIKKGKGYVEVCYLDGQYQVPAGSAGTYLTHSRTDAEEYARTFGAIATDFDGKPLSKSEILERQRMF